MVNYLNETTLGDSYDASVRDHPAYEKLLAAITKYFGTYADPRQLQYVIKKRFDRNIRSSIDIIPQSRRAGDMLTLKDLDEHAQAIVDWLIQIPRSYSFYIPIPQLCSYRRGEISLADDLGFYEFGCNDNRIIIEGDPDLEGARTAKGEGLRHDQTDAVAYLVVRSEGFFDPSEGRGATAGAIAKAKQFLFLARLTSPFFDECYDVPTSKTGFVIDESLGTEHAAPFILPAGLRAGLRTWEIAPWFDNDDGELSANALATELRSDFKVVLKILADASKNESILTACEWAFDSWYEFNDTIAFMFLSIAFEALLDSPGGSKGLADTLGNNLALIVATSNSERDKVRSNFRKYYQIRSKVVHGKQLKCSLEEQKYLLWGREYFLKLLKKEVEIAIASTSGSLT